MQRHGIGGGEAPPNLVHQRSECLSQVYHFYRVLCFVLNPICLQNFVYFSFVKLSTEICILHLCTNNLTIDHEPLIFATNSAIPCLNRTVYTLATLNAKANPTRLRPKQLLAAFVGSLLSPPLLQELILFFQETTEHDFRQMLSRSSLLLPGRATFWRGINCSHLLVYVCTIQGVHRPSNPPSRLAHSIRMRDAMNRSPPVKIDPVNSIPCRP